MGVLPLNANENAKINPEPEEMWSLGEREREGEKKFRLVFVTLVDA